MNIKDLTIGVIGNGTVGTALGRAYCEHVKEVKVYDKIEIRSNNSLEDTLESDLIFLCLPTPQLEGSYVCDTSNIIAFFNHIGKEHLNKNFVLKSTVPIGFTEFLYTLYKLENLVHCPEFLTARTALYDACNPSRNVIGIPCVRSNRCGRLLSDFLFQRHPYCPTIVTGSNESELIKLGVNGAYAHKIAYFNELRRLCDVKNLDWDVVRAGIISDGKIGVGEGRGIGGIGEAHTQVPGHDGKYGFGGNCLPKDLGNLIVSATVYGVDLQISKAVMMSNREDRKR